MVPVRQSSDPRMVPIIRFLLIDPDVACRYRLLMQFPVMFPLSETFPYALSLCLPLRPTVCSLPTIPAPKALRIPEATARC